ncbi:MAG: chemotaxis response regulator protein-glutamate methylesterase [Deltaproteobacteria bacterium HGW-Deltaproteobacteria-4]|nr:MAG: chemotaxis response regulator protein-glutamate methylesterase [Deltaproteobacteria bacterium HGW-Deltaproteobacteria-4]
MPAIRVLVVDDSAFNRRTIIKMLEAVPGIEVVGYACDGEEGLRKVFDLQPDLITLDLEMPRMDGFTFLRIVMAGRPTPVIVISARSEDENVFRALDFGAVDFVAKPSARISPELFNIREDLVRKVLSGGRTDMSKVLQRNRQVESVVPLSAATHKSGGQSPSTKQTTAMVVIGASTGGPPALQTIFSAIREPLPVAFAIAQHMPPGFTRAFAERMNKLSALTISEAVDGDLVLPGKVFIAPGGKNLVFERSGQETRMRVVNPSPEQRYVPSVDILFTSAAETFAAKTVAVVLTGMGNDGHQGVMAIKKAGGTVIAESEESSVVFGMPKEAIATGCVDTVVPLALVCGEIMRKSGL